MNITEKIDIKNLEITSPERAFKIFSALLDFDRNSFDFEKEHFWTIGIIQTHTIKFIELITLGILDESPVHPREVYRPAIIYAVPSIIIGHNHPSGNIRPSLNDKETTHRLYETGKILGIQLLDHIIVGNNNDTFYSFLSNNELIPPEK